jgi:hypothetical protein
MTVVAWIVVALVAVFFWLLLGHKKEYVIHKKLLTPSQCQKIIDVSNNYKFDDHDEEPEPVDGKPTWQIDIYSDGEVFNPELWNMCLELYEMHFKRDFYTLDYVFLRRYRPEERQRLFMHFDECQHAVNVLLSNTSDVDGGELYIFDRKSSREMGDRYLHQMPEEMIDEYIATHPNLPIVPYEQGDAIEYSGDKHLHGTLPVTKGTRYMLAFFYK